MRSFAYKWIPVFLRGPYDFQMIKYRVVQVVGTLHEESSRESNEVRKPLGLEILLLLSRALIPPGQSGNRGPGPGLMKKSHYVYPVVLNSASTEIKDMHSHTHGDMNPVSHP